MRSPIAVYAVHAALFDSLQCISTDAEICGRLSCVGCGSDMRILNILSGIAVLITTLAFGHLLHRYFVNAPHQAVQDPAFLAGMATGLVVGIFSFIGGCLLLRRGC